MEQIRKSMVFQWKLCPKKFDYRWMQNKPEESGVEAHFGRIFHYDAKVFFEGIDTTKLLKCETRQQALDYFEDFRTPHPVVGKWLNNFFDFEARRWAEIRSKSSDPLKWWMPIGTELEIHDKEDNVEMHVDRIDRLPDNTLINVDYKTEKGWYISKLRAELAFYNVFINASHRFAEKVSTYGCYNPQVDRAFSEAMTLRLRSSTYRLVKQFRNSIDAKDFPPRPGRFCRYCSYVQLCIDAGVFDEGFVA